MRKWGALAVAFGIGLGGQVVMAQPAAAEVCAARTFTSPSAFTVTVCLVTPSPGDTLTGTSEVTATASVDPPGATRIDRMVFWSGGETAPTRLLTDFDAPYRMVFNSARYPNGPLRISARAVLPGGAVAPVRRDSAIATVTIDNPGPPPPVEPFTPWLGDPAPGERFKLAAVGDGVDGSPESEAVAALVKSWDPDAFAYLGDVYNDGEYAEFDTWYSDPGGFGQLTDITNPTVGNHEYRANSPRPAGPYFEFWGEVPHYYSYDIGTWHIVVLDSDNTAFNQLARSTEQMRWLAADLAANKSPCTLMYAHHARYTNVVGVGRVGLQPAWEMLYDDGATIILGGHAHTYERWTPLDKQTPQAQPQAEGITQFVVGSGGKPILNDKGDDPRVEAQVGDNGVPNLNGALLLELGPTDANFTFQSSDGSYTDSGTVNCRTAPEVKSTVTSTLTGNDGWERGDVSLTWDTSDPESPVTEQGCEDVQIIADQPETTYTCTATSGGGITSESEVIKRDGTPPVVTCESPPRFVLNQADTSVTAGVADALSGAVNATETVPVDTSTPGVQFVTVEGTDIAGNTGSAECAYHVVYGFVTWTAPVDPDGVNDVQAGKAVPLKWRVVDANGTPITTLTTVQLSTALHPCGEGPGETPLDEVAAGGSGLQNLGDGHYQYNWKTPRGYAGTCRTVQADLGDGLLRTAEFQFTA